MKQFMMFSRWVVGCVGAAALSGRGLWAEDAGGAAVHAAEPMTINATNGDVAIRAGDRTLLEYRSSNVPNKPYVVRLLTPGGANILRDSPPDHKHHHGLMLALAADGVDFWSETPASGKQRPKNTSDTKTSSQDGLARASFSQSLDWVGPRSDKPVLVEQRTFEAYTAADLPATLLTWRSSLSSPPGNEKTMLTGSHYNGVGMRFVPSMDKGGKFFGDTKGKGINVRGTEYVTPAAWFAYTASADGHPVTVALFTHPANARHPAPMFTMTAPFAYLSATLNLWKDPLVLKPGAPLDLCYGVALWDGTIDAPQVEKMYQRWLSIAKR